MVVLAEAQCCNKWFAVVRFPLTLGLDFAEISEPPDSLSFFYELRTERNVQIS